MITCIGEWVEQSLKLLHVHQERKEGEQDLTLALSPGENSLWNALRKESFYYSAQSHRGQEKNGGNLASTSPSSRKRTQCPKDKSDPHPIWLLIMRGRKPKTGKQGRSKHKSKQIKNHTVSEKNQGHERETPFLTEHCRKQRKYRKHKT